MQERGQNKAQAPREVGVPTHALPDGDEAGFDIVLEATNAPEGLHDACRAAAIGGEVCVVGIPDGNRYEAAGDDGGAFHADALRRKGLTLRWSRRMDGPAVYPVAIDLVERGAVCVDELASHTFGLDGVPAAFELMDTVSDGVLKPVIDMREEQ